MPNNAKPVIADIKPSKVALTAGETVSFCTYGLSAKQPFCDGSHRKAGEFTPIRHTAEKTEEVFFCCCKQSKNQPFCDGSHKALSAEQKGSPLQS